jgi:hypothetical protein
MHDLKELSVAFIMVSALLFHCFVLGLALSTRLGVWNPMSTARENPYLKCFVALSSGLMIDITTLFLLASFGILALNMIFLVGGLLTIFAFVSIYFDQNTYRKIVTVNLQELRLSISRLDFNIVSLLGVFIILVLIAAFRAPGWDAAMYHLPLARAYVENRGLVFNEYTQYLRFPLFPQNMEMLLTLGLMIDGDTLAQEMATVPVFITSVGLVGAGVWFLGSGFPGVWSVLFLLLVPAIRLTLGHAEVDGGLALFSWGATLAIALWATGPSWSRGLLIIAGMLAGGAIGTKMFGGVLAVVLGLYLLLIRRDWAATLTYAIAAIAFGSWWYVRSAIISGDPIHPLGGSIFGYFLWNAADLQGQWLEQQTHGVGKNPLYLVFALQKAGVSVWVLAFLAGLYARKENATFRMLYGIFIIYILFWFWTSQVDRYLAPVFAVASFLSSYFLYRALGRLFSKLISEKTWLREQRLAAALSIAIFVTAAFLYMNYSIEGRSETLQKRAGYALFQHANELIPSFGPRLVQVGFENDVYYFNGTVVGDWFGPGRYGRMMTCSTNPCQMFPASRLIELMKNVNSRMLAVNTKLVSIDIPEYEEFFDLSMKNGDGVLLTLR